MKYLKNVSLIFILVIIILPFEANAYELLSFNKIRNKTINEKAREVNVINFNEFLRIYYFNYLKKQDDKQKNISLVALNKEISNLKYPKKNIVKKPPIILHWTASKTSLGAVKTLFQERKSMEEGIIGVDYLITEPLYHPDKPKESAKSYVVDLSSSEVATTWFHVPKNKKESMKHHHKKYNKAINIEIMGWRFFNSSKGKYNDYGEHGKLGIRENFNGDFKNFDENYKVYSTVIKFLNYLSEEYNFSNLIDEFKRENEIDKNLLNKGILYLNGPLSNFIKGHGLIAIEHTLLFNSDYIYHKKDFVPEELLTLFEDLKSYRKYLKENDIENIIESKIVSNDISSYEIKKIKNQIDKITNISQKEYLLYLVYLSSIEIKNLEEFNYNRIFGEYLESNYKEKYLLNLVKKYLFDNKNLKEDESKYFQEIANNFKNNDLKNNLIKTIKNKEWS